MPRIAVPDGKDPLVYAWTEVAPDVSIPAAAYSDAVYQRSSLSLREFEAARFRIARINDCLICTEWRSGRDVSRRADESELIDEEFYEHVGADSDWSGFSERERLAAEFAERYATDHLSMDDRFWEELHRSFDDAELVDLALCVASWLALGRFNRVFDLDGGCRVR
ncbi:MAG TPA: hypothetical protein VEJ87_09310 [Acidimicrobiales bacterium]|nr:hypothetical protein [Acidimicrobiales bacterium]